MNQNPADQQDVSDLDREKPEGFNQANEMDQALALLEQMPVEEVKGPPRRGTNIPAGSYLPFVRNYLFAGREEELIFLASKLKERGDKIPAVVVQGEAGIGKTELAIEFAHRYGRFFAGGVYWLDFSEPNGVPASIVACGLRMGLYSEEGDGFNLPAFLSKVNDAWQEPIPRLLIFDGCEDESLYSKWRPGKGGCRVVLTGRSAEWLDRTDLEKISLNKFSKDEAVSLLASFRPDLNQEENNEYFGLIAEVLDYFPLALTLAGSVMKDPGGMVGPNNYLSLLDGNGALDGGDSQSTSTARSDVAIKKTFSVASNRLKNSDQTSQIATTLFQAALHFSPGKPIPWDLLRDASRGLENNIQKPGVFSRLMGIFRRKQSPADTEVELRQLERDGLARLEQLSLVTVEKADTSWLSPPVKKSELERSNQLRMAYLRMGHIKKADPRGVNKKLIAVHELIVAIGGDRGGGNSDHSQVPLERVAVEDAVIKEAYRLNSAQEPLRLIGWQNQLRYLADTSFKGEDDNAAALYANMGYHLDMIGDLDGARQYYEQALTEYERVLGPEHPDTAASLNNLGLLLKAQDNVENARQYFERALAIREKVLGLHHPDTAASLNNLGVLYREQGDYDRARPYYERSVLVWENLLGENHPDTAVALSELGVILQAQGDFASAKIVFERVLAIDEMVYGEEHPEVAADVNNLGVVLESLGDFDGAKEAYHRALLINEKNLGPDHPQTEIVRANFEKLDDGGELLINQGE